jgi:hypothetical protein
MEDKLVKCNHCGSELCYASPVNETSWLYNCSGCGFSSNDLLIDGEYDIEEYEAAMPELYKDLKSIDNENKVWYPIVVMNEKGMVFIDGTDKDNWTWSGIKNRNLTQDEIDFYVLNKKEVPPYKTDASSKQDFDKTGFLLALTYIIGEE